MQTPSDRTRVRRIPDRGRYDTETIYAILDDAFICHLGFSTEEGPVVIPTIHARVGDTLYLHGSHASRMMRSIVGAPVCITVTHVDGIVAARSAFHHSLNYRSAMVFGAPRIVEDPEEREAAFKAITNQVLPGRWDEARQPNTKENKGTSLLAIEIAEASAKVRTGPPGDDAEDMNQGIWAGVIPMAVVSDEPIPAPDLEPGVDVPPSVRNLTSGS